MQEARRCAARFDLLACQPQKVRLHGPPSDAVTQAPRAPPQAPPVPPPAARASAQSDDLFWLGTGEAPALTVLSADGGGAGGAPLPTTLRRALELLASAKPLCAVGVWGALQAELGAIPEG